jgi:uncharacterized protein YlaN (UPF0358 family)
MPVIEELECPSCHALYKVVRTSSAGGLRVLDCKVCKRPLVSEEEGKILEYTLIKRLNAS